MVCLFDRDITQLHRGAKNQTFTAKSDLYCLDHSFSAGIDVTLITTKNAVFYSTFGFFVHKSILTEKLCLVFNSQHCKYYSIQFLTLF